MRGIKKSRRQISFHYDVSNEFFRLWLDKWMVYSCAYFKRGDESIDEAQLNKLDYICRKLRLKPGEKLLDIGCGWGGLIVYAAKNYGVYAKGITLSRNQFNFAREWIKREGLASHCQVDFKDYRELEEEDFYDKVVSVGMFEHVGIKNLPIYFKTVRKVLKEKGLFLNHGITKKEKWRRGKPTTKFLDKYIFPGGELAQINHVLRVMEENNFEILDVESLRQHYAKTLRLWVKRLQEKKAEALRYVDEETYRKWLIYMAASAISFEEGNTSVFQVLASKQTKPGLSLIPLTRADLYEERVPKESVFVLNS